MRKHTNRLRTWALQASAATLGCLALFGACVARTAGVTSSPASVKAAFIYHFAEYVEWPAGTDDSGPLLIGVIGADDIARELSEILPGRKIGRRPVSLRTLQPGDDVAGLDILFIGKASGDVPGILHAVRRSPILLVTDTENALDLGSMINFVRMDDHVRFEIAPNAATAAGLKLSSRLLAVATRLKSSGLLNSATTPLVAGLPGTSVSVRRFYGPVCRPGVSPCQPKQRLRLQNHLTG